MLQIKQPNSIIFEICCGLQRPRKKSGKHNGACLQSQHLGKLRQKNDKFEASLHYIERPYQERPKRGRNEGRKEGMREGRKEGKKGGRKEGRRKRGKEGRRKGGKEGRKEGITCLTIP
jgi:hypothetical protein